MKSFFGLSILALVLILTFAIGTNLKTVTTLKSQASEPKPLLSKEQMTKLGLEIDEKSCPSLYKVKDKTRSDGTPFCTHGPDPMSEYQTKGTVEAEALLESEGIPCIGNGQSGERFETLYVRPSNRADRYNPEQIKNFRGWLKKANAIFVKSSAQTGGYRGLRLTQEANCEPTITNVVINPGEDENIGTIMAALEEKGFNKRSRKYIVFLDSSTFPYCGQGTINPDDRKLNKNKNNNGPDYAVVACWSSKKYDTPGVIVHEASHTIGAVQLSAPHSTGYWHCFDGNDIMCYKDNPNGQETQHVCSADEDYDRLDCNKDDYFHTHPEQGNYLFTHWNMADSKFLDQTKVPSPTPPPSGKVEGSIFIDSNLNAVKNNEKNETSLQGTTILLAKKTGNSNTFLAETNSTNDKNGINFTFEKLSQGNYAIGRPDLAKNLTFINCNQIKTPTIIPTDNHYFYCKVPGGDKFIIKLMKWTQNGTTPFVEVNTYFKVPQQGTTIVDLPIVKKPTNTIEIFE